MNSILNKKTAYYLAIVFILIFLVFSYFYGIFYYNYPVPPGDDGLRHMTEASHIIETGYYEKFKGSLDPPLFHILLSSLTITTGQNIAEVTKLFAPLLAILSTFSIYFLARRYFNKKIALISLLLFVFVSPQPFGIYEDGTYLNLLGAEFFLVILLSFLPLLNKYKAISLSYPLIISLFTASVILTHSLSATYLAFILIVFIPIFVYLKFKNKLNNFKQIILIYLLPLILLPFAWNFYLKNLLNKLFKITGINPSSSTKTVSDSFFSFPPAFNGYIKTYSYVLIILGTAGFIILLASVIFKSNAFNKLVLLSKRIKKYININFDNYVLSKNKNLEKITLILWSGILLVCSRFSLFMFPSRFSRDAVIPITIMSAIALYLFFKFLYKNKSIYFVTTFVLLLVFFGFVVSNKITNATQYHEQIRLQQSDMQALEWIKNNTGEDDEFVAMPKSIVSGSWGNYIELLTNRKTIDGSICPEEDDSECDTFYNPNSVVSMRFYKNNSIDYVYAGKKIMGEYVWKDLINWSYQDYLNNALFLEKVIEFEESEELGKVVIYKVNQKKIEDLLNSN